MRMEKSTAKKTPRKRKVAAENSGDSTARKRLRSRNKKQQESKPPPVVLLEKDVIERWIRVREEKSFSADEDVARFLLSWYLDADSKSQLHCSQCHGPLALYCQECRTTPDSIHTSTITRKASEASDTSSSTVEDDDCAVMCDDSSNSDNNKKGDDEMKNFCPFCMVELSRKEYYSHMARHKDLIAVEENGKFKCKSCTKPFRTFKEVCKHARILASESECGECKQAMKFWCQLREHKTLHRREVWQYCKWCQKAMVDLTFSAYQKHLREHREEEKKKDGETEPAKKPKKKARMCAICGKVFRDKTYLDIHMTSVHSDARPFACSWPDCNHTSKTKKDLHDHEAFHGEKREVCDQCGMKFHRTVELKLHMQDHFGKKFQCKDCHRRFKKPFDLKEHVDAVHLGIRRFPCTDCEKKFQSKWALTKHVESVHLDYRPFKCSMCDYASKTKQALEKHTFKHTKLKPFHCADCGQNYSCESSFKKHRVAKHKESVYVCKVCDLSFPIPRSLHFHMRMCHNEVSVEEDVMAASSTANTVHADSTNMGDKLSTDILQRADANSTAERLSRDILQRADANSTAERLSRDILQRADANSTAERLSREILMQQQNIYLDQTFPVSISQ